MMAAALVAFQLYGCHFRDMERLPAIREQAEWRILHVAGQLTRHA
jgi:hypothetical protein